MPVRYAAFQIPGQGLIAVGAYLAVRFWDVPVWLASIAVAGWVLKDVVMYPFVRIAYEPRSLGGANDLIGRRGRTHERIERSGYVRLGAELWRAEPASPDAAIEVGVPVRVVAVRGITVLVQADDGTES